MKQISLLDEIIVDNLAGGGGASTGIELATGHRPIKAKQGETFKKFVKQLQDLGY
ncbi:hypothetical protein [uncultured Clostridium sp.]|uniref:hypothetical protein n=1 Tax=uncultured Clostridium sp. TaxID=59620 RepID=UPI0028EC5DD8|nr:hypothetical protein [uncultured Clostridium sp.]